MHSNLLNHQLLRVKYESVEVQSNLDSAMLWFTTQPSCILTCWKIIINKSARAVKFVIFPFSTPRALKLTIMLMQSSQQQLIKGKFYVPCFPLPFLLPEDSSCMVSGLSPSGQLQQMN